MLVFIKCYAICCIETKIKIVPYLHLSFIGNMRSIMPLVDYKYFVIFWGVICWPIVRSFSICILLWNFLFLFLKKLFAKNKYLNITSLEFSFEFLYKLEFKILHSWLLMWESLRILKLFSFMFLPCDLFLCLFLNKSG